MRYVVTQKAQKNQQGIAAIEFGLLITLLLIMCAAIASFGVLMWAQQKVSHIVGDSARVALEKNIERVEDPGKDACIYALKVAENDLLLSVLNQSSEEEGEEGEEVEISCEPEELVPCPGIVGGKCLKLTMKITVNGLPLVNMVQALGKVISNNTDGWIPTELSATSTVKITDL